MKKLTSLLLALVMLFTALTLSGCGWDYQAEGYYYPRDYKYYLHQERESSLEILDMYAVSDNNTFFVNDITFELIYGTHATEYVGRQDITECDIDSYLFCYLREYHEEIYGDYYFGLYICDYDDSIEFINGDLVYDIESLENYELIKTISEEEAFSDDYGYALKSFLLLSNKFFRHIEPITIPSEYIKDDRGSFTISIIAYCENLEDGNYIVDLVRKIIFEYEKVDENTIIIEFKEKL